MTKPEEFWRQIDILPLPDEFGAIFVIVWFVSFLTSFFYGFNHAFGLTRRFLALTVAVLLISSSILVVFSKVRIHTFSNEPKQISFVLPLYTCPNATKYWPGGSALDMATPQDFRNDLMDNPDCLASTLLSLLVYACLSFIFLATLGLLLGWLLRSTTTNGPFLRLLDLVKRFVTSWLPQKKAADNHSREPNNNRQQE